MRNFIFVKRFEIAISAKNNSKYLCVSSNLIAVLMIIFHLIVTSIGKVVWFTTKIYL